VQAPAPPPAAVAVPVLPVAPTPPIRRRRVPILLLLLLVPAGLFTVCCGGIGVVTHFHFQHVKAIKQADKDYAENRHDQAIAAYKDHFSGADDKPAVLKRIVEHEAGKGNEQVAREWIRKGIDQGLDVVYDGRAARLQVEVKKARAADEVVGIANPYVIPFDDGPEALLTDVSTGNAPCAFVRLSAAEEGLFRAKVRGGDRVTYSAWIDRILPRVFSHDPADNVAQYDSGELRKVEHRDGNGVWEVTYERGK
jgi:hypothetical protein